MAFCAVAYVGAVGVSVIHLFQDPPMKAYTIFPSEDLTRCVDVRATSERLARQEALRRPIRAAATGDCTVLPAVKAMDSRLVLERGFNALLVVSAILAALWMAVVTTRAWRQDANAS